MDKSPNTPKKILISALVIGVLSFTLGFYFSEKKGLGVRELFNTVNYNIRKFNFGPMLTEFKDIQHYKTIDSKTVKKIIIRTSFANIDVKRVDSNSIYIDVTGNIKNEIEKEALITHQEGNLLFVDIANRKVSNPTSTGLNGKINISNDFKGIIEVYSESGRVTFEDMNEENILAYTISGDINFQGYRNNTITVSSESGSCYLNSNNIHADISLNSGNINMLSSTVQGSFSTISGDVNIKAEGITSTTQIITTLGDVKFTAPLGYIYEVFAPNGNFTLANKKKFRLFKGSYNNGVNLLRVSSSSGNITLE